MSRSRRFLLFLLLIAMTAGVLPLAGGCVKSLRRRLVPPQAVSTLDPTAPFLKAHLRDGRLWVLQSWTVDRPSQVVTGTGYLLDANRHHVRFGSVELPPDSVAVYESNEVRTAGAVPTMIVLTAASAIGTLVCLTNPKTCFGSCPTFYLRDGAEWCLRAEGFSSSVAPCLEAADIDALSLTATADTVLTLRMRNEALETHVVRAADILAVPRADDGRSYHLGGGAFVRCERQVSPQRARGPEGDCLAELERFDGRERVSRTDSLDLAARETIELEFPESAAPRLGLVITARQSLVTTYLFYQWLAYMGNEAGWWLASLERGGAPARDLARGIGEELGRIELEQLDAGGRWRACGAFGETGPLASDTGVIPLAVDASGPVRLRLRFARGCWRIDGVALAELGERVSPVTLRPMNILREGRPDEDACRALIDSRYPLVTVPGDEYTILYRLPRDPGQYEYFLRSRGYYLEWIRKEWLPEENPDRVVEMVLQPGKALRDLAPAFKAQESTMEAAFWGSRFERERGHGQAVP